MIDDVLTPSEAVLQLNERRERLIREPMQYALQNLIDSHDTDRLASMIVNAGRRPYAQPERFDYDIGVSPRYVPSYDVRKPNDRERRDSAAGRAVADDVRRAADDLLRHRGRHVGRRRPVRPACRWSGRS